MIARAKTQYIASLTQNIIKWEIAKIKKLQTRAKGQFAVLVEVTVSNLRPDNLKPTILPTVPHLEIFNFIGFLQLIRICGIECGRGKYFLSKMILNG